MQISRLVTAFYRRSSNDDVRISSREGCIYELKQPKALFKGLCENPEVKEWLALGDFQLGIALFAMAAGSVTALPFAG